MADLSPFPQLDHATAQPYLDELERSAASLRSALGQIFDAAEHRQLLGAAQDRLRPADVCELQTARPALLGHPRTGAIGVGAYWSEACRWSA